MGIGSSIKKAVNKTVREVKRPIDKAGGGTRVLSYVAPYTALATTKGRAELGKTYGPFASLASGVLGGTAGQGAFAAASESGLFGAPEPSADGSATVYSDAADGGGGASARPYVAGGAGMSPWLIVGGVAVVGLVVLLVIRRK